MKDLISKSLPSITNLILALPRMRDTPTSPNPHTSILSDIFSAPAEDESNNIMTEIRAVLKAVLIYAPKKTDTTIAPAWLHVLGNAMLAYSVADPNVCAEELGDVWKTVWSFLESNHRATRKAAAESLGLLSQCFTPELIKYAIQEAEAGETGSRIGSWFRHISGHKRAGIASFCGIARALFSHLGSDYELYAYDDGNRKPTPAAKALLLPLIQKIGDVRIQKDFIHREADTTLATAMRVLGPEVILQVLPLNLEPADR